MYMGRYTYSVEVGIGRSELRSPHYPAQAACPLPDTESSTPRTNSKRCRCIRLLGGIAGARVLARLMDVDVVGVLAFGLVFVFGSRSHLGWRPCLGGFPVVSADMGCVRRGLQGRERGWRIGGIVDGAIGGSLIVVGPWLFVEGGGGHGGHSWLFIDRGDELPWPFVDRGCGWSSIHRSWWWALVDGGDAPSWPFVDPGGEPRGRYVEDEPYPLSGSVTLVFQGDNMMGQELPMVNDVRKAVEHDSLHSKLKTDIYAQPQRRHWEK
ncbi:uncharacterized protein LACBIDRAFT_335070 [Laccaria bicolor S238N-H82]|uniref:Predicted protein n=1 Tax=Laccaria bicolor (strain S238N-H82 / ATCC MYA-4686) TaxID=486041 RepID=B0E196_LACBS|nr:uncharacterized protein LACBIDRAFT_335070 [Laccaria bicolor S238N-H82]EDQ99422.1 predicted protein [Laccaria bicolor S238N-H82]|eukprot:XP_001889973.1 predicted protein [Laccaria bicolor S238N-H82]